MSLKPYPLPVHHIFSVFLKKVTYHSVLQKELWRTLWRRGVSAERGLLAKLATLRSASPHQPGTHSD